MIRSVVTRKAKEPINVLLKRFKKRVNASGHIQELKENKTYTKPTTERRKAKQKAIRDNKRQNRGL